MPLAFQLPNPNDAHSGSAISPRHKSRRPQPVHPNDAKPNSTSAGDAQMIPRTSTNSAADAAQAAHRIAQGRIGSDALTAQTDNAAVKTNDATIAG